MQPEDALPTIAEVAITIAGFTGIVLAFRPSTGEWSEAETIRIQSFFLTTAITLLCAFLPFGLVGLSSAPSIVWGVPLCIYAVLSGGQTLFFGLKIRSGAARPTLPRFAYALLLTSGCLQVLTLLSGLGLVVPYSAGLLVLALVWVLLANATTLALLVMFWLRPPAG
jgi:hypothetical protein